MSHLVLIVDDQFDNRAIYRSLLIHLGYEVIEATDGDEAIRAAAERFPDAILMDMSLPGRDGWAATRALKGDPATAEIPIIALTAHASEDARAKAEHAGVDSYIVKPVLPRVVAEELKKFVGSEKGGAPR